MLQNENLLAKIGFDTAQNEPSKIWHELPNIGSLPKTKTHFHSDACAPCGTAPQRARGFKRVRAAQAREKDARMAARIAAENFENPSKTITEIKFKKTIQIHSRWGI